MKVTKGTHRIAFHVDGEYWFENITEEIAQKLCNCEDRGERYSTDSRYTYSYNGYSVNGHKIAFGTAKACIQGYLVDKSKHWAKFNIEPR